jgi:EF hand
MQAKNLPRNDASIRRQALRVLQLTLASFSLAAPVLAQQATPPQRPSLAAPDKGGDKAGDKPGDKNMAEAAFQRADADKDGKLSKAEAAKLPAVAARFDELDADKDGSLSMAEYMAGVAPMK